VKNTASANYINYNVYAGVSVTTLPTSATSTGFTSSVTGSTVPLRAVIPNGQAMLPGSYSDTLVITVNY
jgi:spore coat protein U-like protein